jgi:hypothetical protein
MEPRTLLEWILLLAVGASALCMFALTIMLAVTRYRIHRKRKASL